MSSTSAAAVKTGGGRTKRASTPRLGKVDSGPASQADRLSSDDVCDMTVHQLRTAFHDCRVVADAVGFGVWLSTATPSQMDAYRSRRLTVREDEGKGGGALEKRREKGDADDSRVSSAVATWAAASSVALTAAQERLTRIQACVPSTCRSDAFFAELRTRLHESCPVWDRLVAESDGASSEADDRVAMGEALRSVVETVGGLAKVFTDAVRDTEESSYSAYSSESGTNTEDEDECDTESTEDSLEDECVSEGESEDEPPEEEEEHDVGRRRRR